MGNTRITRRGFLSSSVTGVVATGLLGISPGLLHSQESTKKGKKKGEIIYRTLGKTGLSVPVVSMGVMNSNNPEIVQASYELGVRHFDTAARYMYGRNEQMVGEVIRKLGARDKVIIGTKELRPSRGDESSGKKLTETMIKLCEGSLNRLKTDYIDILYIHSTSSKSEIDDQDTMEALAILKKQGKIRFAGVSTHQNMTEVINAVSDGDFYDVVLTAFNVTMADDTDLIAAIEKAAGKGVGVVAMKTQAGGQRLASTEASREFSGSTIMTASLKWALNNENITTAIPGYDNFEHMKEDLSVGGNLDYTPEEKSFLSGNNITMSMRYCRQCGQCQPTCPHDVDLPGLMRTHMYAAGYGNFTQARQTFDDIHPQRNIGACASCGDCSAKCVRAIDIPGNIRELKAIYA